MSGTRTLAISASNHVDPETFWPTWGGVMFLLPMVFAGLEYCLSSYKKAMEVAIDAEANAQSQISPSSHAKAA